MILRTSGEECATLLTEREAAVLALVADGRSDKEIASELGITVRTVRFHVGNVFRKTGTTSRVQLAVDMIRGHLKCTAHPREE